MDTYFDHERLEVYQVAREFNRFVAELLPDVPRGNAGSRDNLRRAALSITRNVAEGAGKWSAADKAHFYQIARGSATEAAASLDELVDMAGVAEGRIRAGKALLSRIVGMLTGMIRSMERRSSPRPGASPCPDPTPEASPGR